MDEILDITFLVAEALERLGVPYLIGGSLASSLHGIPRATQDVDIVAAVRDPDVSGLVAALHEHFYLDEDAIRDAVARHSSFNVVHLASYFRADVFVAKDDEATRLQMERRQRFEIGNDPPRELVVASPEDVVAQKLFRTMAISPDGTPLAILRRGAGGTDAQLMVVMNWFSELRARTAAHR